MTPASSAAPYDANVRKRRAISFNLSRPVMSYSSGGVRLSRWKIKNRSTLLSWLHAERRRSYECPPEDIFSQSLYIRGRATYVSCLCPPTNTPPVALEERPPELARTRSGPTIRSASENTSALRAVQEQTEGRFSRERIQGQANYPVDGPVRTNPDVQLKFVQPKGITFSEDDLIPSELTGAAVIKPSWPGTDCQDNEMDRYRDSAGRFGMISNMYEGEYCDVISNVLFVPQEDDIKRRCWQLFTDGPPRGADNRTFRFTVFGVEGKSLIEAKSPRQLSRAWASFLLGAFVDIVRYFLQLICLSRRMVIDIPIWTPAQGYHPRDYPHDGPTCEEEKVRGTRGVPESPLVFARPGSGGSDQGVV
jgi:hypothetical protein